MHFTDDEPADALQLQRMPVSLWNIYLNGYFTEERNYSYILVHKILQPEANYGRIKLQSCQTGPRN
jgi:hypothetical protein